MVTRTPSFPLYGGTISDAVFALDLGPRSGPLLASATLFLLPTIFFGSVCPYVVGMLTDRAEKAGKRTGNIFAIATVGSIVGTLGTSYYLLLQFGTNNCLMLIGGMLIVLGILSTTKRQKDA